MGNSYQDSFARVECKFLLSPEQYEGLMPKILEMAAVDEYGRTKILNTYYDTPDYRLIRTSLEKPVYKEKLRLRSYGVPEGDTRVFMEIKKKYDGIVYKRRVSLSCAEAEKCMREGRPLPRTDHPQIDREIAYFREYYEGLRPAMAVSYDRVALAGTKDPHLRITLDENICWRTWNLRLSGGGEGKPLLSEGQRLMELKFERAVPLELARRMSELGIRKTNFSKYGMGYKQYITGKENESCHIFFLYPSYQTAASRAKASFSARSVPC